MNRLGSRWDPTKQHKKDTIKTDVTKQTKMLDFINVDSILSSGSLF